MSLWIIATLAVTSIPSVFAQQNFIPSTPSSSFPACAFGCPQLQQAQTSCLPPQAPVTSQSTYQSCFCQSGLLAPFYSSPNGVCDAFCTNPSDLVTLQNWYKGLCANTVQPTTLTTTSSSTTGVSTSTGSSAASSSSSNSSKPQGWFATHWRWVLMIILLAILLPALALLIICLKRRSKRKQEAAQLALNGGMAPSGNAEEGQHFFGKVFASSSKSEGLHDRDLRSSSRLGRAGTPGTMSSVAGRTEMWGPHQGMAHTRGWGEFSSDDLQTNSIGRSGPRDKSVEAAIGSRAMTADGDRPSRPSGRKDRRNGSRHGSRKQGNGKGKERSDVDVSEDNFENMRDVDRRRKRRSRSQRHYREKEVDNDTTSRFSM